jgi:hypothetical protein
MESDEEILLQIITKMVRKPVVGIKKVRIETAKGWVATHNEGRAEELLNEMLTDPGSPIEGYGGRGRKNIRLTSVEAGAEWIEEHGGDVPFGVDY